MSAISNAIQKQQFHPGLLGILVNPFYIIRRELLKQISSLAGMINGRVLDVGCGSKPYEKLFIQVASYTGMDFDSPEKREQTKADVFYDGKKFPFPDRSFDSVIATEVLEHIFNPDEFMSEISRVIRKDGTLLITTPFIWDEHEQPFDYARYSSFGLRHILMNYGFEIVIQRKTVSDVRAIFQIVNCFIYKVIPIKNYRWRIFFFMSFCAPTTVIGILLSWILPKNDDLYLSNVVLAKKI